MQNVNDNWHERINLLAVLMCVY
eukprot:SAG11_NODE_14537_length_608_cov_1.962672_1_plen_22_part_10